MTQPNVVCVVGAGASLAYGFPTGPQLVDRITSASLQAHTTLECEDYRKLQQALQNTSDDSIDAFLESRQGEFDVIGRRAIAEWLIRCELPTNLVKRNSQTDWVRQLLRLRLPTQPFEPKDGIGLSFVTFNYDRSLEAVMFACIQHKYGLNAFDTGILCRAIPVIHVHGSLGKLPWQVQNASVFHRDFVDEVDPFIVESASNEIRVIYHKEDVKERFEPAWKLFESAERIYFFGFGYHATNLERLQLDLDIPNRVGAGTSIGLSVRHRGRLRDAFPRLSLYDMDIPRFLSDIADI